MFLHKYDGFRIMSLQVSGTIALTVLVPASYQMIGAAGIQAAVGTADHIDEPSDHRKKIIY